VRTFAICAWVVYVLAANAMLVASAIDVETILATGPTLTVAGLLLAYATRPLRSRGVLIVALSGPLMAAFIALNIAMFQLGPHEAQQPVTLMLACYLFLFWPAALYSLFLLIRWNTPTSPHPRWMQFSLKTLLIAMTAMCVSIVIARQYLGSFGPSEGVFFAVFGFGVVLVCALIFWRHHAVRSAARAHSTPASERPPVVDRVDVEHVP
jgi:hypothetical protein